MLCTLGFHGDGDKQHQMQGRHDIPAIPGVSSGIKAELKWLFIRMLVDGEFRVISFIFILQATFSRFQNN